MNKNPYGVLKETRSKENIIPLRSEIDNLKMKVQSRNRFHIEEVKNDSLHNIYILGQCIKCNEPKCMGYTEKGVKCDFLLTLDKDVDNTCCKTQDIIPHPVHITSIV